MQLSVAQNTVIYLLTEVNIEYLLISIKKMQFLSCSYQCIYIAVALSPETKERRTSMCEIQVCELDIAIHTYRIDIF